jgi:uncharacterized protein YutE (UPF0331/DUF86 family)
MPDVDFVLRALQRLEANLTILRDLAAEPLEQFLQDPRLHGSAERYLQVSVEICLDVTRHLVATENLGEANTHAEAFERLAQAGIIPPEFVLTGQRMAGFRNRLVHLYWDVEEAVVYDVLQNRMGDFDSFRGYVLTHLIQLGLV